MGLREKKKQHVRHTVLARSAKLFELHGFSGTSMDQIAAAAMVSRTTLFNYFPSKDSIVLALAASFEDTYPAAVRQICAQPGTTAQRIEAAFVAMADYFIEHRAINSVIYLELNRIRSANPAANSTVIKNYLDAFVTLLQLGIEQDDVRTDIDPELMADVLWAPLSWGLYRAFSGTGDIDIRTTFRAYAGLLNDAVAQRQQSDILSSPQSKNKERSR